jgi:4-amino-4-deoxy-L-arabinose transferase-like glycosyltransferase
MSGVSSFSMWRTLPWIVATAFALRFAVRWFSGDADFWENGYPFFVELARNMAAGNGIAFDGSPPTAFRVPLYPAFLSAVTFGYDVFLPVVIGQSLIGAGTVLCAALIARELFGPAAAIAAAGIAAIYPYYVVHDTALQDTSLCTLLTALAVVLLQRTRRSGSHMMAASAGLALGAAVLTRANLAPFAMLAPIWLVFPGGASSNPPSRRLRSAALCTVIVALTLSPWLIRSYRLNGSVALSTEIGFFLWLGNNPDTFSRYPSESIDRVEDVALAALDPRERAEIAQLGANEAHLDRWFLQRGLEYIRRHPWLTIGNGVRKIEAAFGVLPSPRRSFVPSLVHALSYGPVMILGLWGMWAGRRYWRDHLIFYALFVSFGAVTAMFFGHTSYRAYLDLYCIVFAAGMLERLQRDCFASGWARWSGAARAKSPGLAHTSF